MMTHLILIPSFVALLLVGAGACAPSPTKLDPAFGHSVAEFRNAQILNPSAQGSVEPVEGLQGVAANNTIKKYEKTFSKKQGASKKIGVLLSTGGQGGTGT